VSFLCRHWFVHVCHVCPSYVGVENGKSNLHVLGTKAAATKFPLQNDSDGSCTVPPCSLPFWSLTSYLRFSLLLFGNTGHQDGLRRYQEARRAQELDRLPQDHLQRLSTLGSHTDVLEGLESSFLWFLFLLGGRNLLFRSRPAIIGHS